MRILYILEYYYPNIGGVEKLFKNLAESRVSQGDEVTVITTLFNKNLPKEETINGVQVYRLNLINRFFFTVLSIPRIYKAAQKCDFIHTTSYNAGFPAIIAGMANRKKVIITFHEVWGKLWFKMPFLSYPMKVLHFMYEYMLLKLPFSVFVAVSMATREKLISAGIRKSNIVHIYNGINYAHFDQVKYAPSKIFTFSYYGRLGISKGLNLLIPAAGQFIRNHPDVQFNLIIPTIPKATFKKVIRLTQKHIIDKNLHLYHNLSEKSLYDLLSKSTCIVIPSYSEGFCFAAVEAAAMEIPVISSNRGALKEVISGKNILMEEFSSKGIIRALEEAYTGHWTTETQRKFDIISQNKKYNQLYANLIL